MSKPKFTDYDMRKDFEFHVYVTDKLSVFTNSKIKYVDPATSVSGVLKKSGDFISLEVAKIFKKPGAEEKLYETDNDVVQNEKDLNVLYASTWDGRIHFIINKYTIIHSETYFGANTVSYDGTSTYSVTDVSLVSQFLLPNGVNQATLYLDYIHEWFSMYRPSIDKVNEENQSLSYENLKFRNSEFSLNVNGVRKKNSDSRKMTIYLDSIIVLRFQSSQDRRLIFDLGTQLRNLFQMMLKRPIGLHKIILNRNNNSESCHLDERENWCLLQSFLPEKPMKYSRNFEIEFANIENAFQNILINYLESTRLQEFVSKFLIINQYMVPVETILLTLSSGVESYFKDAKFSNGKPVNDLTNKLNMIFNSSWNEQDETKNIIKKIKDNRDYYIHGSKADKRLNEEELIPVVLEFKEKVRKYLIKEIIDVSSIK